MPRLCWFYPGICLTTEEEAWKNLSQGSKRREVSWPTSRLLDLKKKFRRKMFFHKIITKQALYEGCPESIRTFWISREPVAWRWCTCHLAASQRPYCTSVNSHCPVGLLFPGASHSAVRCRWLSLCTVWPSHSQNSLSTAILSFGKAESHREPNLGCRGADRLGWCDALLKKPAREV